MTPVHQTRFGRQGNCMAACVASLLDLPLQAVDFDSSSEVWLKNAQLVLWRFSAFYMEIEMPGGHPLHVLPDVNCIFIGPSPRIPDSLHYVVGRLVHHDDRVTYKVLHDPSPNGGGLANGGKPTALGFILPLNFAQVVPPNYVPWLNASVM